MTSRISHTSFDAYAQPLSGRRSWTSPRIRPDGSGWITLADPEGNEFCILSRDPAGTGATT